MKKNAVVSLFCSVMIWMICGGLWTITFPRQAIPKEAVRIYEEESGEERELTEKEHENLLCMLEEMQPEQIQFRSHIWEWLKTVRNHKKQA